MYLDELVLTSVPGIHATHSDSAGFISQTAAATRRSVHRLVDDRAKSGVLFDVIRVVYAAAAA